MDAATRKRIAARAGGRCEYCRLPQSQAGFAAFHVEHVIARQHRGPDDDENLALACHRCNAHKGPNLAGYDPDTGEIVRLFHPRRDAWTEHFFRDGPRIRGLTGIGRTTVWVLQMNAEVRLELRAAILEAGENLDG